MNSSDHNASFDCDDFADVYSERERTASDDHNHNDCRGMCN